MNSIQKLELETTELFKQKEYSKVVYEITSQTKEEQRSTLLCNLLGLSRIINNKQNKAALILAIKDFKTGYLKKENILNSLDSLANFITTNVLLIDLENNHDFDFSEIINFYEMSEKICQNHRPINLAMAMVFRRLNDAKKLIFHFKKIIESKKFNSNDLCSYGYWQCFDKQWKQSDFLDYGKFLDENLRLVPQNQLVEISQETGPKIKIGFLSSDIIQGHSITYFLKTVLSNYDKSKFEIILFLNNHRADQSTEYFKNLVDKTVNIHNLNNVDALNRARELKLDIMVDLMGYTSKQRLELFKNRMAKKQVIWMGYCNTTGLKNMDYIISDQNLIYENEKDLYAEQVLYLPEIWNTHCGFDFEREENSPPLIKNNYITFGSFNNPSKINENVIGCWAKILEKIKNSKLIFKCPSGKQQLIRIKKSLEEKRILDSVIFHTSFDNKKDHLNLYKKVDIVLDTFPYNGVTTSFEAIWMGVPVLTMAGYNFNSRCGESINKNLGMEQLIAKDEDEYVRKAVDLTNNYEDYINLRKSIFNDAIKSPLFNVQDYSKSFFEALKKIVK